MVHFEEVGIPIDEYTQRIPRDLHQRIHPDWNYDWEAWIAERDAFTPEEAAEKAIEMMEEYGLSPDVFPLKPWGVDP